jgi:hypothetical protein
VDLQLSGHTHGGQLWPASLVVRAIYELAWGYRKIANTHIYAITTKSGWIFRFSYAAAFAIIATTLAG